MKKLILFILLLPFFASAQWTNGTIQREASTGRIRYIQGANLDSLVRIQLNSLSNLDMLRYNAATGKFIPRTPSQVLGDIGAVNTALSNLSSVAINTSLLPGTSDGAALGSTSKMWSDQFLADGGVINWNNGNVSMTHSDRTLSLSSGAGNASFSVTGYYNSKIGTSVGGTTPFQLSTPANDARGGFGLIGTDGTNTGSDLGAWTYLDNGTAVLVWRATRATGATNFSAALSSSSTLKGTGLTLTSVSSGTANTDSILVKNASTNVIGKVKASDLIVSSATNTAITDDLTTNATMYPTWVTANTGNLPQKVSSTKLSFNPSTGTLTLGGPLVASGAVQSSNSVISTASGGYVNLVAGASPYANINRNSSSDDGYILHSTNAVSKWKVGVLSGSENYIIQNVTGPVSALTVDQSTNVVTMRTATLSTGTLTVPNDQGVTFGSRGSIKQDGSFNYIIATNSSATAFTLGVSGNFTQEGATATKASGTTWANPSDVRLKRNVVDYKKGLKELMLINPKEWYWNAASGFKDTQKHVSPIAQELQKAMPEMVSTYKGKLNGRETDLLRVDGSDFTMLLINAVKEQQVIIEKQDARILALEKKILALEKK